MERIKETEMKRENFRWLDLIHKTQLNRKNKVLTINIYAVPALRYGIGMLKWTQLEI